MPELLNRLTSAWRLCQFILLLACAGMIAYALYEQFSHWLMPCLMCIYQRLAVIAFGLTAAIALVYKPSKKPGVLLVTSLQLLAAVAGLFAAGKHVWLQYAPHETTVSCASSLPFPINFDSPDMPAWLAALLRPVGECSQIDFSLLGLSMPVWVFLAFLGLLAAALLLGKARLTEINRRRW